MLPDVVYTELPQIATVRPVPDDFGSAYSTPLGPTGRLHSEPVMLPSRFRSKTWRREASALNNRVAPSAFCDGCLPTHCGRIFPPGSRIIWRQLYQAPPSVELTARTSFVSGLTAMPSGQ